MKRRPILVVGVVLLGLTSITPPAARAAVFNVASGDTAGLVSAIATANGNGEADTINLAAGTYNPTGTLWVQGELAIVGAGAATTTVARNVLPRFSLLLADFGARLRVEGVTLASGGGTLISSSGGAIYDRGERLEVVDCVLSGNVAESGGAIFSSGGEIEIRGSTFTGNQSRGGNAVDLRQMDSVTIEDSQFTGNVGSPASVETVSLFAAGIVRIVDTEVSGNSGTGIAASTGVTAPILLTIERATISGNGQGIAAGGGFAGWMKTFISDSTIADNVAGGGVSVSQGEMVIRRSTISGNASDGNGGGIIAFGAGAAPGGLTDVTIESSTISGNLAKLSGGGIYVESQLRLGRKLRVRNSTITGNTADSDGNGSGNGGGVASTIANIELAGTILAGNGDLGGEAAECSGPLASQGHNVIGSTAGCAFAGVAASDQTGASPLLGPLAANGGPTETHLPLAGSPAIDRGDDASCPGLDQRGRETRIDGDGDTSARCDVGAVEASSASPAVFFSDPYLCHGAKTSGGTTRLPALTGVALVDDVDALSYKVDKTDVLCTPISKNGEDVADDVTHLHGRAIKSEATFVKEQGIRLVNQLGAVTVDAVKPNRLLVPASKDLAAPPSPPDPMGHDVDRYKCFQAKISTGTPKLPKGAATLLVAVADQFTGGRALQLSSVSRVCAATDAQGLGRKNPDAWLVCYKARVDLPLLDDFDNVPDVYSASEFGTEQVDLSKKLELCVPSRRVQ